MDNIELDNLDNKPEEEPEEQQEEEETNVDTDWRDESVIIIDTSNPDAGIPKPKKDVTSIKRAYTEDEKSLLREMGIKINKKDSPSLFERLKVTINGKGKVNGAKFDGVKIIELKGKRLDYTKASKVNEFKELVKVAEGRHARSAQGFVEESISDIPASEHLVHSVIRDSIENLGGRMDENVEEVETWLNDPAYELTIQEDREARGLIELDIPTEYYKGKEE